MNELKQHFFSCERLIADKQAALRYERQKVNIQSLNIVRCSRQSGGAR